ncbi:hypothetical protein B0I35DRAFT_491017 [Stachybotrys elegans]|uniref:Uncharacterized protein n=1 Tax=Stachybotrys elegans TaxID=80388 RepID=A0A8K0SIG8_9HYPO|nr:hypothetical protein B0I35DRAFT_491017 [Stachybotrys elegans]
MLLNLPYRKRRVFVALYYSQGLASNPRANARDHTRFHWAIWVEPRGSKGEGACYQVLYPDRYLNGSHSGEWLFNYQANADYTRSHTMLGRIMVGKLPPRISLDDVRMILTRLPLPVRDSPIDTCDSWAFRALEELQKYGCVDDFDVPGFMDHAHAKASEWCRLGGYPAVNKKENYRPDRKFP